MNGFKFELSANAKLGKGHIWQNLHKISQISVIIEERQKVEGQNITLSIISQKL